MNRLANWCFLALVSVAMSAAAQVGLSGFVSVGRKVPSVDEVARAFSLPEPESGLRPKGVISATPSNTPAGPRLRSLELDVAFGFGTDSLLPKGREQLAPVGEFLRAARYPAGVVVEAFTEDVGSVDFTDDLSRRRAQAVREFLVQEYKLDPTSFSVIGRGKQVPKDRANPASDVNRRVLISLK